MKITTEEAIRTIQSFMTIHPIASPTAVLGEAIAMAFDALREQEERENPNPLTMEELKQMGGCPVYVVPLNPFDKHWEGWNVMRDNCSGAELPGVEHWSWELEDYGNTWIAYRHKPKEDAK